MIVVNKENNADGSVKEVQLVNVTTKRKKLKDSKSLRRAIFNRNESDLVPIDPQHPFPCPCFAKLKCHYVIENFSDIDNLIHYGGESIHDSVIDEIKNCLSDCDNSKYFTESQIKAHNIRKFLNS